MKRIPKFAKLTFVRYTLDSKFGNRGCNCIVQGTFSDWYPDRSEDIDNYALYVVKDDKIAGILVWCFHSDIEMLPVQDRTRAESLVNDYLADKALEDI